MLPCTGPVAVLSFDCAWHFALRAPWHIPGYISEMSVESCRDASPTAVWSQYVSKRRPCIFRSLPTDLKILAELVTRGKMVDVAVRSDAAVPMHLFCGKLQFARTPAAAARIRWPPEAAAGAGQ